MPPVSLIIGGPASGVEATLGVLSSFCLPFFACHNYFFLAVFADCLNAFAVGAPFDPAFLILSPDPALIRSLFF